LHLQEVDGLRQAVTSVEAQVAVAEHEFREVLSFFALPTKKLPKARDFWMDVLQLLGAVKAAQQQALEDHRRQVAREARAAQKVSRLR